MRINYKPFPTTPEPPLNIDTVWWPVLPVVVFYNHRRSQRIEAIVDSGCQISLFHADIGRALGIPIERGREGALGGVISGARDKVYYHRIRLAAAGESFDIVAGFSPSLSVPALLGQIGFFDHFVVTFDYTPYPPCFELQKIERN